MKKMFSDSLCQHQSATKFPNIWLEKILIQNGTDIVLRDPKTIFKYDLHSMRAQCRETTITNDEYVSHHLFEINDRGPYGYYDYNRILTIETTNGVRFYSGGKEAYALEHRFLDDLQFGATSLASVTKNGRHIYVYDKKCGVLYCISADSPFHIVSINLVSLAYKYLSMITTIRLNFKEFPRYSDGFFTTIDTLSDRVTVTPKNFNSIENFYYLLKILPCDLARLIMTFLEATITIGL